MNSSHIRKITSKQISKMFRGYKYLHWIMFIYALKTVKGRYETVSDNIRKLHNILIQKSWYWDGNVVKGIADQQVFTDGNLREFIDIVGIPPRIDETNIHTVTSKMYVALGCKCGEMIIDILNVLMSWMDYGRNFNLLFLGTYLKDVNRSVLKTVSVLFTFVDIAPNVLSFEPGMLKSVVSLNLYLNDLIEISDTQHENELTQTAIKKTKNMIFQLINVVERTTISYCTSVVMNSNRKDYFFSKFAATQYLNKLQYLINRFHNLLENTGLSKANFYKYNIVVGSSEKTPYFEDYLKFDIIGHVLDRFSSVLKSQTIFFKPVNVDIEHIFSCQKIMFDFLLLIVHKNTIFYLIQCNSLQNNKINSIFFDKLYIKDKKLIQYYEKIFLLSKLKKFPFELVNQIRIILRVLKSVLYDNKIHDFDIIMKKEEEDVKTLFIKNSSFIYSDLKEILDEHVSSNTNKFELHTFLEEIVSIEFVENFNMIYKLLKNNFQDFNDQANIDLNMIQYNPKSTELHFKCFTLKSVYAYCFDIQSIINSDKPKENGVKTKLLVVLNILRVILQYEDTESIKRSNNLVFAFQYLGYNYINYPRDGNIKEKLFRILYIFTNLLDRHQAWICEHPLYRSMIYEDFDASSDELKIYLDLKEHGLSKYIDGGQKSKLNEKTIKNNLKDNVLMEDFVRDFNSVQPELKLLWKGKFETVLDVLNDMKKNIFNFSSIPKYIKVIIEWATSVFSHTILDVINYTLNKTFFQYYSKINYFKFVFDKCPNYLLTTFKAVIYGMSYLNTTNKPFEVLRFIIIGMQGTLENILKQYNNVIKQDYKLQNQPPLDVQYLNVVLKINAMFEKLIEISNTGTPNCCTHKGQSIPLTYVFSNYLRIGILK